MIDYRTLEEMRDEVGRMIGDVLSSGSVSSTSRRGLLIDGAINRAYEKCSKRYRWPQLLRGSEATATVTSGNRYLYLTDKYIETLYFIFPGQLETLAPVQTIRMFFDRYGSGFDSSGVIQDYADAGEFGIKAAFSSTAEVVTLVSDSASDTSVDCLVRGVNSGGTDEVQETVTVTGTTPVASSTTFSDVISVSTDGTQAGVITLAGNTSGTTYATVAPNERTARYKRLRLGSIPSTAETFTYYWKKKVAKLANDDQVPEIPVSRVIIEMAVADQFAEQRKWQAAASYHRSMAEEALIEAWESTTVQGESVQQATPMGRWMYEGGRNLIVVNNTA